MNFTEPPDQAWSRLPASAWDRGAARHLLRRAGWTARAGEVERAMNEGLEATLTRLFPAAIAGLPKPPLIAQLEADWPESREKLRRATASEKRGLQREERERSQAALQDLRLRWLEAAARPEHAVAAKWVLFLGDVYVVSAEKVRNAALIWRHHDLLARQALGPAPALTKAVSRSAAMEMYLDLEQSRRGAPNENFARELFELFVLGEGHYTETDIKEAARAFTGYRVDPLTGDFQFAARQHDAGEKTVFGQRGRFDGDAVIDLGYAQPAAAAFLPGELARFYLSETPLPAPYPAALGAAWRADGFELGRLARTFFGSRLFFAPEFRGNFIKSPVQYYLGLVQDLGLAVPPLARHALFPLRQMGQQLFQPPNVRGWVGGRQWINSATLAARRQIVQQVFTPLREELLNADEQRALAEARAAGDVRFTVGAEWLEAYARQTPERLAGELVGTYLAGEPAGEVQRALREFLAERAPGYLRDAAIALFQTPEYQLC